MGGSGYLDGHEIESIINSLDLPMENLEGSDLHAGDWDAGFQYLGLTSDALQGGFGPITSDALQGGLESLPSDTMDVLPSLSVPSNEASQPKQLLNVVEETSGASNTLHIDSSAGLHSGVSQAPSPVSVLESNDSSSVEKSVPISSETVIPVCTRSKRSQSSTFKPRLEMSNRIKRKQKKKKKLSRLSGTTEMKGNSSLAWLSGALAIKGKGIQLHFETRKCTHCEVTETPQWREGPMGPKTLCNACGVRYRSGRLFPEYRPAASPTFVPYLHSNSHKKVIEMRNRTNHGAVMTQTDAEMEREMSPLPEFVQSLHLNSRKKVVDMRNRANHGAVMTETDAEMDREMSPPPEFVPISSYLFDCVQKIG